MILRKANEIPKCKAFPLNLWTRKDHNVEFQTITWPGPSAEMCRGFLSYRFWRILPGLFLEDGLFWALFPTKRRKIRRQNPRKKSGGPKTKMREKSFYQNPTLTITELSRKVPVLSFVAVKNSTWSQPCNSGRRCCFLLSAFAVPASNFEICRTQGLFRQRRNQGHQKK